MVYCCNCKKEISEEDLFCRYCGERQSATEKNKWNSESFTRIKDDECASLPTIILSEYRRIFALLDAGQSYGAVLQLRDVYEICLKLPVIVSIAYLCSKEKLSDADYQIMSILIEKDLSSGTWHELVRRLIITIDEDTISQILNEADELWSWDNSKGIRGKRSPINGYTSFSHWRNTTIGHGALAFDDQEEYFDQFKKMLEKLNEYCKNSNAAFSSIKFDEANTVNVKGENYSLYPFVISDSEGMYFFDAYLYGKRKYDTLNYQNAKKNSFRKDTDEEKVLEDLYRNVKVYLANLTSIKTISNDSNSIYSDWHSAQEEEVLDDLVLKKDYVKIDYLTDWLSKTLIDNEYALLAMDSGLGKSSWCRTFDEKFCDKTEVLNGYVVKVVYINKFYNKSVGSILSSLEDVLALASNGQRKIKLDNPRYINRRALEKRKELADVLEFYYDKMHQVGEWNEKQVLLIFDGLDEMSERSFLEWIPQVGSLNNHYRFLFTVRSNDNHSEIKNSLENNLGITFTSSNTLEIHRDSIENVRVLSQYVEDVGKERNIPFTPNDVSTLLKKSNNTFLYLTGLLQVVTRRNIFIPTESAGYLYLLEYLRSIYSSKYYQDIEKILGILVITKAPISIRELAQVLGYEAPSYLLASYIKDITTFLVVEFRQGEAYYSLAHDEVALAIKSAEWFNPEEYYLLLKNCVLDNSEQLTIFEPEHISSLENEYFEGSIYILKNMHLFPGEFQNHFASEEKLLLLNAWCDVCGWSAQVYIYSHIDNHSRFKIYVNIYRLCESLFEDKSYFVFEAYLRMMFLSPEFIGYYAYSIDELTKDQDNVKLFADVIRYYEEHEMSSEELNIYEREIMIYPAWAGRIAIKGILMQKKSAEKHEEKLADALSFAIEILEDISEDPNYCSHDIQFVKAIIRELSINAKTLVDKKILNKYGIHNLKKYSIDIDSESYEYVELYQRSTILGMDVAEYVRDDKKIQPSMLNEANELYESVLAELKHTNNKRAQYCLVSYLPPIVVVYKLALFDTRDKLTFVNRIINIYELYDKYGFTSHEIHHYINALVTYAIIEFNYGNKENAVKYLRKTIEKYEYCKKQPYYSESIEILCDVCNAYYTLSLHYASKGQIKEGLKNLKEAQKIYKRNPELKNMFAIAPEMIALLEGMNVNTNQIGKAKIGRNAPCPCGSGKKYKHCCGK